MIQICWPYSWLPLQRTDTETDNLCVLFIWGTEKKIPSLFRATSSFPAEAQELDSAWSQRGKGNTAKGLADF